MVAEGLLDKAPYAVAVNGATQVSLGDRETQAGIGPLIGDGAPAEVPTAPSGASSKYRCIVCRVLKTKLARIGLERMIIYRLRNLGTEPGPTPGAASIDHRSPALGTHTRAESVSTFPLDFTRLECSFHDAV